MINGDKCGCCGGCCHRRARIGVRGRCAEALSNAHIEKITAISQGVHTKTLLDSTARRPSKRVAMGRTLR